MNSIPLTPSYASLGRRFLALLIDGAILLIPAAICGAIIPFAGALLAFFLYAPVFESSRLRATPGKYLVGIEVVDLQGDRLSFRAALLRNIVKAISTGLAFVGFLLALFSEKKQTVHDLIAESVVIYGRTETPLAAAWTDQLKSIFNSETVGLKTETQTGPRAQSTSVLTELERLQGLREKGALTEEEFQEQKRKLLSPPQ